MMGALMSQSNLGRTTKIHAAPGDYDNLLLNQPLRRPQVRQQRRLEERKVKKLKNSLKNRLNKNR